MKMRIVSLARLRRAVAAWNEPEPEPENDPGEPDQNGHSPASQEASEATMRAQESLKEATAGRIEMTALTEKLRKERQLNHFAVAVYTAMKRNGDT